MLLFGPFGGLTADRVDKRRLLFVTQSAGGLLALALGILVVSHQVQLWQVYLLAGLLGVVNLFDNPARQTFMMEMVGRDDLPNAVSLNSVVMNASRVIGPALGGVIITIFGLATCFFVNSASYLAVIVGLSMMHTAELRPTGQAERARGQIREGLRYVWRTPALRNTLLAVSLIGVMAYNFTVTLALLARGTFHGGAGTYALLTSSMAVGAVVGGLAAAHRARPTPRLLQGLALLFGGLMAAVALPRPWLWRAALIVLMGAASIGFLATANASLQLGIGAGHARSGDGPLRHGLPRHDTDRRPPGRCHRRVVQPEGRHPGRRAGHRGGRRPVDMAARGGSCASPPGPAGPRWMPRPEPSGRWRPTPPDPGALGHGLPPTGLGSLGRPSTRSPTMLRWISAVPPQIVSDREKKNEACRSLTG